MNHHERTYREHVDSRDALLKRAKNLRARVLDLDEKTHSAWLPTTADQVAELIEDVEGKGGETAREAVGEGQAPAVVKVEDMGDRLVEITVGTLGEGA